MSDIAIEWYKASYSIRQGFFLRPVKIIDSLSLIVPKGACIGLIGPNGAGKTTTLKLGAGVISPQSGSVKIKGLPAESPGARPPIGFLTENQYVYPNVKLCEWLRMLGALSGIQGRQLEDAVAYVLKLFKLTDKAKSPFNTLSKGQTQRAGFAQALLHDPEILILDEPMSGMDPLWRSRMIDLLLAFKKNGGTIIFSSHIMSDVLRLSDKIVIMNEGAVSWEGRLNDLSGSYEKFHLVFHADQIKIVEKYFKDENLEKQPDGSFLTTILPQDKKWLFQLAAKGDLTILALNPQYVNIEDIFV